MDINPERCDLCDIKFTSPDHANSHYAGRKHKKKCCDISAYATTTNSYQLQNFCHYCKIQVSGPAPMRQHKESARHIKKVQELRSRNGSDTGSDTSQTSPTGSTYNEFDNRPDSTMSDGERNDVEEKMENYSASIHPRTGSFTLLSNPPQREDTRCFQEDGYQPSSANTVLRPQNGVKPNLVDVSPTELAAKLEALTLSNLRQQLITSCTEMIQKQLESVIPTIVEKIVDKTLESLQEVGRQQQQEALGDGMMMMMPPHSPEQNNLKPDDSYGSFQTPASSVCSQLFPTPVGHFETAPVSINGHSNHSMNGHHSFAGSPSSYKSYHHHPAKVTIMPPPGFGHLGDENKY